MPFFKRALAVRGYRGGCRSKPPAVPSRCVFPRPGRNSRPNPQRIPVAGTHHDAEPPPKPTVSSEDSLEPSVYRFILRHSLKQQILLLVLTLVSFPFLYYSLDLPKTIVNHAIGGKHFPQEFLGIQLDQIPYLMTLCGIFLGLVFINGGFKYYINTLKGQLGERMLRRFRYALYLRLLRFPTTYFQKTSSAQIIPMMHGRSREQLGGFIGDAFVLPLFQGGQLLTIIVFMFMQDPILGSAAVTLYPIQGYVIPKLQYIVNQLQKRRIRTICVVADRVRGIGRRDCREIQANDTVKLQLTGFAHILWDHLRHQVRDLPAQVFRQIPQQLHRAAHSVLLLFDRRLSGDQGQLVVRRAGRGARRLTRRSWPRRGRSCSTSIKTTRNSRITYEQIVEQFRKAGQHGRCRPAARRAGDDPASVWRVGGGESVTRWRRQEPCR